jgi:hypothetical protein
MTGVGTHKVDVKGRNKGSAKARRSRIVGQFAPRPIRLLESAAYRVLSLSARRVFDRVEIELAHHGGADNGALPVTYDDFERYGIHRHSIAPAIREAAALGFIEITEPGRAGNADWRKPTLFRLTYRNTDYAGPTDEWSKVETDEEAQLVAQAARFPVAENAKSQCGNRHRKRPNHSTDSTTTGHSTDSTTTSIFSGGERRRAA